MNCESVEDIFALDRTMWSSSSLRIEVHCTIVEERKKLNITGKCFSVTKIFSFHCQCLRRFLWQTSSRSRKWRRGKFSKVTCLLYFMFQHFIYEEDLEFVFFHDFLFGRCLAISQMYTFKFDQPCSISVFAENVRFSPLFSEISGEDISLSSSILACSQNFPNCSWMSKGTGFQQRTGKRVFLQHK